MNRPARAAALALVPILVLTAGCVVRSVSPWFAPADRVAAPGLAGTWVATNGNSTLCIAASEADRAFGLLFVDGDDLQTARFEGSVFQAGGIRLLQVSPVGKDVEDNPALAPAHLLLQMHLEGDTLALFPIELDGFGARADAAKIARAPEGGAGKGYLLTGPTDDIAKFVGEQVKDPSFFAKEPIYRFRRAAVSEPRKP